MGDSITPNVGLIKPEVGASDDLWGEKLNANFDKIDTAVGPSPVTKPYVDAQDSLRVLKSGDTMSGFLILVGPPTANLHAATKAYVDTKVVGDVTKAYVDAQDLQRILKSGDVMTGFLTLSGEPTAPLHAATKSYVDSHSGGGSGGVSISVTDIPPSSPTDGSLWWENDTGVLWIYYNDGSTQQWVQAAPGQGAVSADLALKVSKSGDTMSGDLTISKSSPRFTFNTSDASNHYLVIKRNDQFRWFWYLTNGAETGANVGSDFVLQCFDDVGTSLGFPLAITRKDMTTNLRGKTIFESTTPSTSPTTGALTVAGGVGIGGALFVGGSLGANIMDSLGAGTRGLLRLTATSGVLNAVVGSLQGMYGTSFASGIDLYTDGAADSGKIYLVTSNAGAASVKLSVDKAGIVNISQSIPSTSPTTGALTVAGGVGIGGALNVVGAGAFGGNITVNGGTVQVGNGVNTLGLLRIDGAGGTTSGGQILFVVGGVGRFVMGNASSITGGAQNDDFLFWMSNASPNSAFRINAASSAVAFGSTVPSTSPTTGAITVGGGVGIGGNLHAATIGVGVTAGSSPGNGNTTTGTEVAAGIINISLNAGPGLNINTNSDGFNTGFRRSGTLVGSVTVTATATAFNTSSDERLKEDLKPFDGGKIIDRIEVFDFKWKSTQKRDFGIIAQHVNRIYPNAIAHFGDNWSVDYSKFVPLLLQEIKDLRSRVKRLEH